MHEPGSCSSSRISINQAIQTPVKIYAQTHVEILGLFNMGKALNAMVHLHLQQQLLGVWDKCTCPRLCCCVQYLFSVSHEIFILVNVAGKY